MDAEHTSFCFPGEVKSQKYWSAPLILPGPPPCGRQVFKYGDRTASGSDGALNGSAGALPGPSVFWAVVLVKQADSITKLKSVKRVTGIVGLGKRNFASI